MFRLTAKQVEGSREEDAVIVSGRAVEPDVSRLLSSATSYLSVSRHASQSDRSFATLRSIHVH